MSSEAPEVFEVYLKGIDCANCAAKLEREIKKIPYLTDVTLNFMSGKLSFVVNGLHGYTDIISEIETTVKNTEPDVKLVQQKPSDDDDESSESVDKKRIVLFIIAVLLVLPALFIKQAGWLKYTLFLAGYLLCGYRVIVKALKNIFKGRLFDENFLMTVATVGAFAVGELAEGVAVMLFYELGMMLQNMAVHRSRKSIE